jgi:hypothetical protein
MAERFALPPGIYFVRTTEDVPRDIVNAGGDGQRLFVAAQSLDNPSHQVGSPHLSHGILSFF